MLADGRVLLIGGEYNHDEYPVPFRPSALTNMSAIYDPRTDNWTMIPPPAGLDYIGDASEVTLADGRVLLGDKLFKRMWIFDPATSQWSALSFSGYPANDFAEMGFTLLPSGSVLTRRRAQRPANLSLHPGHGHLGFGRQHAREPRRADRHPDHIRARPRCRRSAA